jgi:hypothetical protein
MGWDRPDRSEVFVGTICLPREPELSFSWLPPIQSRGASRPVCSNKLILGDCAWVRFAWVSTFTNENPRRSRPAARQRRNFPSEL